MTQILILNPQKLKEARGHRTLDEICRASGNLFKPQQISAYEKGLYRPRPERIPQLLKALGVNYEEVASPLEILAAAAA